MISGPKIGMKADVHPSTKDLINFASNAQIRIGAKFNALGHQLTTRKFSSASLVIRQVIRSHHAPLFSCCKSYSGNLPYVSSHGPLQFFTGDMKGTISCFRLVDDQLVQWRAFKGGFEPVWALSYAHPGFLLSSTPNKIKLFDLSKVRNKNEDFSISTNKRFFGHLEFLTPENFVVNSFSSKTLKNEFLMFDLMKEKESEKFVSKQGLSNFFKSIAKSDLLISANEDRTISFYDIRMKEQIKTFVAHSNAVVSLDVNTDRHLMVTAGCDASIRMWDFRYLNCLTEMPVHRMKYDDSIFDVKFDPSADLFCTAGADSSVKIFQF
jgi:WD40 repeat protein